MSAPHLTHTPLMQQYCAIKAEYTDALLLFQVGDFYELFFDDAKIAAAFLAIALTKRGKAQGVDIPLCGIPVHAVHHYLVKLIKGGFKVAIADQVTKPVPGTVVERKVTRFLTPGTLTDLQMLDDKSPSYLCAIYPEKDAWGVAFAEILTAQIFTTSVPAGQLRLIEAELIRFLPDEIVLPAVQKPTGLVDFLRQRGYVVSFTEDTKSAGSHDWISSRSTVATRLRLEQVPALAKSVQVLYYYLIKNNAQALEQVKQLHVYEAEDYLVLDASTQKNLELVENSRDGGRSQTLFAILDRASTAMGSRMIKKWLLRPLVQQRTIEQRHEVVAWLAEHAAMRQRLATDFAAIADLERIIGRIAMNRALIHDYIALRDSIGQFPAIFGVISSMRHLALIEHAMERCIDFSVLEELLRASLPDDTSTASLIKNGFDYELDHLRSLVTGGQQAILDLEQREIARTGITSLKIRYTDIYGYAFEVTKTNTAAVPEDFVLQQTLANRNRYVTQQLKALEQDLARAHREIDALEQQVFERIKKEVAEHIAPLRNIAYVCAMVDALIAFATAAHEQGYVRPTFNMVGAIEITQGRHPVVEQSLQTAFIPNDAHLSETASTWIVTGPNMGGKSTFLRQIPLICIMAQCGSFVPAVMASLPLLDRIFTRIGSGDNVADGKSTFLVEMEEAAAICDQATSKSLVILDEVGRGTSTYDGMALARAIVEFITLQIRARCLFATHYHELTDLAQQHSQIKSYHAAVRQTPVGIHFLHTIELGVAPGSFGIEVARRALLPHQVIQRAQELLAQLHANSVQQPFLPTSFDVKSEILTGDDSTAKAVLERLDRIDPDNLTPRQALDALCDLKEIAKTASF